MGTATAWALARAKTQGCCCGPFRVRFVPAGLLPPMLLRLLEDGPRTGYELLKEVAVRTDGFWTPGPAAIYPTLRGLEEKGFVTRSRDGPGRARPYSLTPAGRRCMQDWKALRSEGSRQVQALSGVLRRL